MSRCFRQLITSWKQAVNLCYTLVYNASLQLVHALSTQCGLAYSLRRLAYRTTSSVFSSFTKTSEKILYHYIAQSTDTTLLSIMHSKLSSVNENVCSSVDESQVKPISSTNARRVTSINLNVKNRIKMFSFSSSFAAC